MRALPAYLAWVVFLGAVAALPLADPFPLSLTFVTPASLHPIVLAAETLFVLFAWPFLRGEGRERLPLRALGLVALGLPVALLAENISAAGFGTLIRGQVLVLALAALVSGLSPGPAYLLAAFALSFGLPAAAFVGKEFGGADLGWLALFSPVWSAFDVARGTSLAFTGLAAAGAAVRMSREAAA